MMKSVRRLRRDRGESLSIITDEPLRRTTWAEHARKKRVSEKKLQQHFTQARTDAYAVRPFFKSKKHTPKRPSSTISSVTHPTTTQTSQHFHNFSNTNITPYHNLLPSRQSKPSEENSVYFTETTVQHSSVTTTTSTSLGKSSDVGKTAAAGIKQPLRGILKASKSNLELTRSKIREENYWTCFIGNTDEIKRQGKVHSRRLRAVDMPKPSKGWNACSGFTMTRDMVPEVQREVASFTNSGSSQGSSPASMPSSTGISPFVPDTTFKTPLPQDRTPMPWIVNHIKPPTPAGAPEDPMAFLNVTSGTTESGVMVGEWMSRETMPQDQGQSQASITKKYSVAQLMDILCGYAIPTDSELAGAMFQPESTPIAPKTSSRNCWEENQLQFSNQQTQSFSVTSTSNSTPRLNRKRLLPITPRSVYPPNSQAAPVPSKSNYFGTNAHSNFFDVNYGNTETPRRRVSFQTDSQDNISVQEHIFDRITPEYHPVSSSNSGPSSEIVVLSPPELPLLLGEDNKENCCEKLFNDIFSLSIPHEQLDLNFPSSGFTPPGSLI